MEENKSYLIINAVVNKENAAELPTYLGGVGEVFNKFNGKPVGRFKTAKNMAGDNSPEMVAIVEFSDLETIDEMINGEDFKARAPIRGRVFSKLNLMASQGL